MLTGLVAPKLKLGRYWAPLGTEVIEADNATLPLKPFAGVMVIVEVFPAVAPGATVGAVPLIVNVNGGAVTEI